MITALLWTMASGRYFRPPVYAALGVLFVALLAFSVWYREARAAGVRATPGIPPSVVLIGGRR